MIDRKIFGWGLIAFSITVFLVILIDLIKHPLLDPFWLPVAFFSTFLPFNFGFYYVYISGRNKKNASLGKFWPCIFHQDLSLCTLNKWWVSSVPDIKIQVVQWYSLIVCKISQLHMCSTTWQKTRSIISLLNLWPIWLTVAEHPNAPILHQWQLQICFVHTRVFAVQNRF